MRRRRLLYYPSRRQQPAALAALVDTLQLENRRSERATLTLGIGSYGPSLVLFSLLGMEPRAAFPIMMGSGAFMGVVAAMRFVSSGRYSARAALGLTLGGIPGVLIAVWLVRSLPLDIVRWGVIVVVIYTAVTLIRSAVEERRTLAAARAGVPAGL